MGKLRNLAIGLAAAGAGLATMVAPQTAQAYSVRVHIHLANEIRDELGRNWTGQCDEADPWCGQPAIRLLGPDGSETRHVVLQESDAQAILDFPEFWRGGAIGPDNTVFPGMTDPSHAPDFEPFRQCETLVELSEAPEERAYALGCFLHGVTDNTAHHLVNYLSGETFTLYPKDEATEDGLQFSLTNVVRHMTAETRIEHGMVEANPEAFTPDRMRHQIAKGLYRRAYLDPEDGRGMWHFFAEDLVARKNQWLRAAQVDGFDPEEVLDMDPEEIMEMGSAIELDGRVVEAYFQFLTSGELGPADYVIMLPEMVEDIKLLLELADASGIAKMDALVSEWEAEGECRLTCPILSTQKNLYVHLFGPGDGGTPSLFRQAVEVKRAELDQILTAYLDSVERLSNLVVEKGVAGLGPSDLGFAFDPMFEAIDQVSDFPYDIFFPGWASSILSRLSGLREFLEGTFLCITREFREQITDRAKSHIELLRDQLTEQFPQANAVVDAAVERLREVAGVAIPDPGAAFARFDNTVGYMNSFNAVAGVLANREVVHRRDAGSAFEGGPVSFDASYQLEYNQMALCEPLRRVFYPCGTSAAELLQADYRTCEALGSVDAAAQPPVECHRGGTFDGMPSADSCAPTLLPALLEAMGDLLGSYTLAFPPALAPGAVICRDPAIPGLTDEDGKFDESGATTEEDAEGCGCRSTRGPGGAAAWLIGLLVAAASRRRRV